MGPFPGGNSSFQLFAGKAAVERGLEIDPTNAAFFLVRGRLLLLEMNSAAGERERARAASEAVEALTRAESLNPLLARRCAPLLSQARNLGG